MRLLFSTCVALGSLGLASGLSAQAPQQYGITSIGALPDFDPSIPTDPTSTVTGINEAGHATGSSHIASGCIQQPPAIICERIIVHAVLWQNGVLEDLGPPVTGLTPPEYVSIGWAVNNNDWVAGEYTTDLDTDRHAFVWRRPVSGTGFDELPPLGGRNARAWDINDAGVAVGESTWPGGSSVHAVYWTEQDGAWTPTDLGTFGGPGSQAFGINAQGEITGVSSYAAGQQTTFLHLPAPAYGLPAGTHDITPGIGGDFCKDINEKGEMVGGAGGIFPVPMIVLPEPAYGLPAGATVFPASQVAPQSVLDELGATSLLFANFTAINNHGLATVSAWFLFPSGSQQQHGMLYQDGVFRLAKSATTASQRWPRMTGAEDVNDNAEIGSSGVDLAGHFLGAVLKPLACQQSLGFQGPGTALATLCGTGLNAGQRGDYEVVGGPASSVGLLLVSRAGFPNLPIFGGTLASFGGNVARLPVATNTAGTFNFTVRGSSAVVDLVLQTVLFDPSLPRSFAFSNAIRARFGQ